jgi:hypothetical protein
MKLWHSAAVAIGMALAVPVAAQELAPAIDLGTVAQGALIQGTMEGHADRARARKRGQKATLARADECARAWGRREQMNRAQRQRLYDLCPR